MRVLLELSGESEELARAEVTAIALSEGTTCSIHETDGRALVLDTDADPLMIANRVALAWSASAHQFSCPLDEITPKMKGVELPGRSFRIKVKRLDDSHEPEDSTDLIAELGELLSSDHSVDLDNPDVEVRVLMAGHCHIGFLVREVDRSAFESRKTDSRPFSQPISLHPRFARALVNLSGVKKFDTILDPFCGTGGILMEAAMMGIDTIGSDIDDRMLEGTRQNLEHFGLPPAKLIQADISDVGREIVKVNAIVTDTPYGRSASTGKEPIGDLYKRAFASFREILETGGKLAIVLPSEEHVELAQEHFTLIGQYPVRVHRSLTRHICVFEPI